MKVITTSEKPILTILCLTHGHEVFGKTVFEYFKKHASTYPHLQLILGNEEAYIKKKRYIETDLNRSYPGNKEGSHEEKLAYKITPLIQTTPYLIDIHNTKTDMIMTPIITHFNNGVLKLLSFTRSKNIVKMPKNKIGASSIDMSKSGIGLEFSFDYSKTDAAMKDVIRVVNGITKNKINKKPFSREVFEITGTIANSIKLPVGVRNFEYVEGLRGYTFLVGNNSYTKHQGFYAKTKITTDEI